MKKTIMVVLVAITAMAVVGSALAADQGIAVRGMQTTSQHASQTITQSPEDALAPGMKVISGNLSGKKFARYFCCHGFPGMTP